MNYDAYMVDTKTMRTCHVCKKVLNEAEASDMRTCKECGCVYCKSHLRVTGDSSRQVGTHELRVTKGAVYCPNGHKMAYGSCVFSPMNFKTIHICKYSNRHFGSALKWGAPPTCRLNDGGTVSQQTWDRHCVKDGAGCALAAKANKPWWRFW